MSKSITYRVAEGPMHEACMAYRTLRDDAHKAYFTFSDKVGGVGFFDGNEENVGNATAINAVIFDEVPTGWKERRWKSFSKIGARKACWPDKRTNAGKELLAEIAALPMLPCADRRICIPLGIPTGYTYRKGDACGSATLGFWSTITVGWIKDVFYITLPDMALVKAQREADGWTVEGLDWEPDEFMQPILKEEADLDFARAKLEAAA